MSLEDYGKKILKKLGLFEKAKEIKKKSEIKKRLTKKYKFENRMKNKDKLCIILAGYQELVWDIVFKRIKMFIPDDIDVCILSSGKYSDKLSKLAKDNDWSYLSTKRNNLALIQNVAIDLFKNANYIYKLDEDMFVTDGCFEMLMKTLKDVEQNGEYKIGVIAPTIPINGFGYVNIIKRFNLIEQYKKLQEEIGNNERLIRVTEMGSIAHESPLVAKFLWESTPNIDKMNDIVKQDKFEYEACPIRFSIGMILFKRDLWKDMELFDVLKGTGLGMDERKLCTYCLQKSRPIIVSKNTIVGHLAYGPQKSIMEEYYRNNKNVFDIH